ncbi:MAG: hypothetical protein VXW38_15575 [Bacteroidota bacterium]|nr:hypothetical protein [Bacteroidota bacterium]
MSFFGVIVALAILFIGYKTLIVNAVLPLSRIQEYLVSKQLEYIRHQKIKKPWNPQFENGETLLDLFYYPKHYYLIDAIDCNGDPIEVEATWYQSMSLRKNRVFFKTKP